MLILPGNPLYEYTLATARPPGWQDYNPVEGEVAFIFDDYGLARPATRKELLTAMHEEAEGQTEDGSDLD